jgi:ferrochelatase
VSRLAVVLFNLGGPDSLDAIRPFLFNLFRDRAIVDLPAVARYPLAAMIAGGRDRTARANYALMGGASPILKETKAQIGALEQKLRSLAPDLESRAFVAMRYWKPFAAETAREVAAFAPDTVVLLPLYPQYSTTTTASSVADFRRAYRGPGEVRTVCCYPEAEGLVEAHVEAIREVWDAAGRPAGMRLLLSAHGLPKRVVEAGDPYQIQVEATAAAIAARIPELADWRVCYQSRVGRLEWLGPQTDDEIRRAGAEGLGVIVAPIAFVSEHVETLVELDHDYAGVAEKAGARPFLRSRTPGVRAPFIQALAQAVLHSAGAAGGRAMPCGGWRCPAGCGKCPWRKGGGA